MQVARVAAAGLELVTPLQAALLKILKIPSTEL